MPQGLLVLALLVSKLSDAHEGNSMSQNKFDHVSYGRLNTNELAVKLHLWQGSKAPVLALKPRPTPPQVMESIELPLQGKDDSVNDVSASLEFTNISSREIHVLSRFWFTHLKVFCK